MTSPNDILPQALKMLDGERLKKQGKIYPSQLALGCMLKCYHDLAKSEYVPEELTFESAMMMDIGSYVHGRIQAALKKYYESIGWAYFPETSIKIGENVSGRCDAVLINDKGQIEAHEYKTCSKSVFASLKNPKKDNVEQFQTYMAAVDAQKGHLLYICRDNFERKGFVIKPDPSKLEEIMVKIKFIEDSVASKTPPAPKKYYFSEPCTKTCAYRQLCPEAYRPKKGVKFDA